MKKFLQQTQNGYGPGSNEGYPFFEKLQKPLPYPVAFVDGKNAFNFADGETELLSETEGNKLSFVSYRGIATPSPKRGRVLTVKELEKEMLENGLGISGDWLTDGKCNNCHLEIENPSKHGRRRNIIQKGRRYHVFTMI